MTGFRNLMTGAAGVASGGYEVDNSVVLNDGDSQYLNKTFNTPSSASQFGYSFWVKLGSGYADGYIISADGSGNNDNLYFESNGKITIQEGGAARLTTTQVLRDFHAWYNVVVAYDLGNGTNNLKLRLYINGSEVTDFDTDNRSSLSGTSSRLNANGISHDIGANVNNGVSSHVNPFDGYLAEFVFLDGTVITPSDVGETDSNGVWRPIDVSGLTFGNNGFYLPFTASGALGADYGTTRTAPSIAFLTSAYSSSNTSSYTFSSQSLGTAASDRKIYVCVGSSAVSTAYSFSSVTVAGVTATQIVAGNADNNSSFQPFAIYEADVPSGTTGDVVVNLSGTMANCAIALYRATGAGPVVYSDATNGGSFPSPNTVSLAAQAPKNSVILSHGNKNGQTVRVTLAGVTEAYDFGGESDMAIFGGINTSATSSDAVGVTTSATVDSGSASYLGIATIVIGGVGDTSFKAVNSPTQTTDSPTTNYAVMTPLYPDTGTFSNGNLTAVTAGNDGDQPIGSVAFDSQDSDGYYFVFRPTTTISTIGAFAVGVATVDHANQKPRNDGANAGSWFFACGNGNVTNTSTITNGTWDSQSNGGGSLNDYFQIAVKAGKIYFGKNGTWYDSSDGSFGNAGEAFSNLTGFVVPMFQHAHASAGTVEVEFGALGYTHAKPSGMKDINAANLYQSNAPAIEDGSAYFQATTYTGNGSSKEVNQSGNSTFQPDFVWIKDRGGAHHAMIDAVRGANKGVRSSLNFVEYTESNLSFDTDGFSMTSAGSAATINTSSNNYVAWQWKGGNGTSSNTDGRKASDASVITSTVSLNQTAGFSIVRWTGNGSTSTIGHGLNAKPNMILIKNLDTVDNWVVYHDDVGFNAITLNSTGQRITTGASVYWNDTAHTSSIFNVNTHGGVNGDTNDMIAYCFTSIPGYSRFGAYEGNDAADGPYVHLGFKPAFLMVKNIDASGGWPMYDNARTPNNPSDKNLNADQNASEYSPDYTFDLLSNGFKIRDAQAYVNDANSYLYMAFAEHPFAGTTPATAR